MLSAAVIIIIICVCLGSGHFGPKPESLVSSRREEGADPLARWLEYEAVVEVVGCESGRRGCSRDGEVLS